MARFQWRALEGEPSFFQNKGGRIPPYQGRQLVEMIEKYLEGEC